VRGITVCKEFQIVGVFETNSSLSCHAELREAPDSGIKEIIVFRNDISNMLNIVLNDAVSDTTEADNNNEDGYIIFSRFCKIDTTLNKKLC
jgi:hypothetical protein